MSHQNDEVIELSDDVRLVRNKNIFSGIFSTDNEILDVLNELDFYSSSYPLNSSEIITTSFLMSKKARKKHFNKESLFLIDSKWMDDLSPDEISKELTEEGISLELIEDYKEGILKGFIVLIAHLSDFNFLMANWSPENFTHDVFRNSTVFYSDPIKERVSNKLLQPAGKKLSVWVSERENSPFVPLVKEETYILNFKAGNENKFNLLNYLDSQVAESDIPEEGLETEWLVSTKNIELNAVSSDVSINEIKVGDSLSQTATFNLKILKSAESKIIQLNITPRATEDTNLHIIVSARNGIYRQFLVDLNVSEAEQSSPSLSVAAKKTNEIFQSIGTELGIRTLHEWTTPGGKLNIMVLNNINAFVTGDVTDGAVNTVTEWRADSGSITPAISELRRSAEEFSGEFDDYLNAIDADEVLERMKAATTDSDSFHFNDNADDSHNQCWEKIAKSEKLYRMASYGFALYEAVFPENTQLRQWIDNLPGGWRINISWSKISGAAYIPNIPWGLMYTKPPERGKPIDAMSFFGLRFRLNYMAYEVSKPKSKALGQLDDIYQGNCFYWGTQTNDPVVKEAVWQKNSLEDVKNQIFIPSRSQTEPMKDLLDFLDNPAPSPMPFLYFYCHCEVGDGSKPVLRFGNSRQASDLVDQVNLGGRLMVDQPLVFVNACVSAAGSPAIVNQLVETFFRRDCRAFLGTEIYMPVILASRFAVIFRNFFYRQLDRDHKPMAAGEAVYQTRRFLWNQYRNIGGIFYTYINEFDLYLATSDEVKDLSN